jgi:hypothetical protein
MSRDEICWQLRHRLKGIEAEKGKHSWRENVLLDAERMYVEAQIHYHTSKPEQQLKGNHETAER